MTREEAARRFHLMPERIGELVVLGDKDTVFGEIETEVEALPPTLRTHGSLHETEIPMIIYNATGTLPPADQLRYNFDMTKRPLPRREDDGGSRRSCPSCRTSRSTSRRSSERIVGRRLEAVRVQQPLPRPDVRPAAGCGERQVRPRDPPRRQADRDGARRRTVAGAAPDDRRAAPLEGRRRKISAKNALAAFDFPDGSLVLTEAGSKRRAGLHVIRGEDALQAIDPGGLERSGGDLRRVPGGPSSREPHAQAGPDGSAPVQRRRQRLLRRDPPPGPPLAAGLDRQAQVGRGRATVMPRRAGARRMDGTPAGRDGRRVSREGDRLPSGHGRPRPIRRTLSRVRSTCSADPLRRE